MLKPAPPAPMRTDRLFQQMLTDAKAMPLPFDIIPVHSFSRFCHDQFTWAITKRALSRAGITVQSITQPLTDNAVSTHVWEESTSVLETHSAPAEGNASRHL